MLFSQVIVYALHGALPLNSEKAADLINVFVLYLDYYMIKGCRNSVAYHTQQSLAAMSLRWNTFVGAVEKSLKVHSLSGLQIPKFHAAGAHSVHAVKDGGTLDNCGSNPFEHSHVHIKKAARAGNMKGGTKALAKIFRKRDVLLRNSLLYGDSIADRYCAPDQRYSTAWTRAADADVSGKVFFEATSKVLDLDTLSSASDTASKAALASSRALKVHFAVITRKDKPFYALLPSLLDRYFLESGAGRTCFASGSLRSCPAGAFVVHEVEVVNRGVVRCKPPLADRALKSAVDTGEDFILQRLSAGCFVATVTSDASSSSGPFFEYARVESVFKVNVETGEGVRGLDLILVRWLKETVEGSSNNRTSSVRLTWDSVPRALGPSLSLRLSDSDAFYQVLEAGQIEYIPYIVPDFAVLDPLVPPKRGRPAASLPRSRQSSAASPPTAGMDPVFFFVNQFVWTHT